MIILVIHRNILVDESGDRYVGKLSDFGLARRVNFHGGSLSKGGVGPLKYMAPESLQPPHSFSYRSDSYMFGMTIWETLTENRPFPSIPPLEAAKRILEGERVEIPSSLSDRYKKLITACLNPDPMKRPSMSSILGELLQDN